MDLNNYRLRPQAGALLVCLVGFALLVFQLGEKSLWVDETLTAGTTEVAPGDFIGLVSKVAGRAHPPLYFLCVWLWRTLEGDSDFALRFPSAIFGVLSVAVLYPLGTKMTSERVGLIAMGLMAISPFLILSSRIAQYYSLLLLSSLVSHWFFHQLLHGRSTVRTWVGYTISSALGMYTHYLFAFVLAAQAAVALTKIRRRGRLVLRFVGSQMIVALLFAPWVSAMIPQAARQHAQPETFTTSGLAIWVISIVHPFFAWTVGETIYPWNLASVVGLILAAGFATKGLVSATRGVRGNTMENVPPQEAAQIWAVEKRPDAAKGDLGAVWASRAMALTVFILLPLLLAVVTVRLFTGGDPFTGRRAIFCAPFVYLVIAGGISSVSGYGRRLLGLTAFAIVLGLSVTNYYLGREFHNPTFVLPTKAIADDINQRSQPGDVFVSDAATAFGYYIERRNPDAVHFLASDAEAARRYIQEHRSPRVWLILLCRAVDTESLATVELVPWLKEGYSLQLASEYAPLDRVYAWVQAQVLRKPACEYKIRVHRYARVS